MSDNLKEIILYVIGIVIVIVPLTKELFEIKIKKIYYLAFLIITAIGLFYFGIDKIYRDQSTKDSSEKKIIGLTAKIDKLAKSSDKQSQDYKDFLKKLDEKFNIVRGPNGDPVSNVYQTIDKINRQKFDDALNKLMGTDYPQKSIALDYIINNCPSNLTDSQIKKITSQFSFLSGYGENFSKINDILKTEKKSHYLIDYFKQVISKDNFNAIAWSYLFRNDVNIDAQYAFSIIESRPPHWMQYENIVQYAMENDKTCSELLNSHELIDFLFKNVEQVNLKQAYNWIEKMIERKETYDRYKPNYFFQRIKNI